MTLKKPTYGKLELRDGRWILSDIPPHVAIKLKAIFPRIPKTQTGIFDLPYSPEMSADLRWFFERYPALVSDADLSALEDGKRMFEEDRAASEAILLPDWQPPSRHGFRPGKEAYHSQKQASELWLRRKGLLLGDDVGLGKTIVALDALAGSQYLPAAIVVQAHLPSQWVKEYITPFTYMQAHIIEGTKPYTLPPANLYIFKYTNIAGWSDVIATGMFKAVVFDEIQELRRGDKAEKGKAAKVFYNNTSLRLGLSATPVYNLGSEIWNILDVIDPDVLGPWDEFTREWCTYAGSDKWKVNDPDALGSYLRECGVFLRRLRQGRPINRIPIEVDFDEEIAEDAAELARRLAIKVLNGSFAEAGQASRELDAFARLQTGLAKAKSVAVLARMYLEKGIPLILAGWHRECFGAGTGIMMSDGSVRKVEDIGIGDRVMGPDSNPRNVISTVIGEGRLFRIIPNKGDAWVCSENHILSLIPEGKLKDPIHLTVRQFISLPYRKQRSLCLYRPESVSFPEQDRVFEPWLLGYWLGDGASSLVDFRVSSADREVAYEVLDIAEKYGLMVRKYECKQGTTPCCFYKIWNGLIGAKNTVRDTFRELNLHKNKHIPQIYKTSSISERRELLAGLIDSDGHVYGGNAVGTAEFANTNKSLARDVMLLARSLGFGSVITEQQKSQSGYKCKPGVYYKVTISGDLTVLPMRIERKRAPVRNHTKKVTRTGFRIEEINRGNFYGFETDGDHLFLLEDCTVVHNCYNIWLEELKDFNPVMYTGSETPKQKDKTKHAFISGETNLLLISLRSGAGLDGLQKRCSTVMIGEMDFSPAVVEQLLGRVDRPGQKADEITAIFPYVNYGSDPVIMSINAVKKDQQRGINDPGTVMQPIHTDESRIKILAKSFLEKQE